MPAGASQRSHMSLTLSGHVAMVLCTLGNVAVPQPMGSGFVLQRPWRIHSRGANLEVGTTPWRHSSSDPQYSMGGARRCALSLGDTDGDRRLLGNFAAPPSSTRWIGRASDLYRDNGSLWLPEDAHGSAARRAFALKMGNELDHLHGARAGDHRATDVGVMTDSAEWIITKARIFSRTAAGRCSSALGEAIGWCVRQRSEDAWIGASTDTSGARRSSTWMTECAGGVAHARDWRRCSGERLLSMGGPGARRPFAEPRAWRGCVDEHGASWRRRAWRRHNARRADLRTLRLERDTGRRKARRELRMWIAASTSPRSHGHQLSRR